ncbi:MAG TPA: haloacid dehalogenase [Campylobacteraceae bacterium]|nr:haloacid dehalogenase [Campylobacteraceae bacterium]
MITIPNYGTLALKHVVLDYNGTVARDGILLEPVRRLLTQLTQHYTVHIITADTFGSVQREVEAFDVAVKILASDDHTEEKADFVRELGATHTVAMGNGNNDALMLRTAELSIAILGDEGCSMQTLQEADLVCKSIGDALELLLYPKRLIATLRR